MKNKQLNIELREQETYEAPVCKIIEYQPEGMLCASALGGTDSYIEDSYEDIWVD
jgi:hypothetical protein